MHKVHLFSAQEVLLDLVVALHSEKSRRSVAEIHKHLDSHVILTNPDSISALSLLNATNRSLFSILNDPTMPLGPSERARILRVRGEIAESIGAIRDAAPVAA